MWSTSPLRHRPLRSLGVSSFPSTTHGGLLRNTSVFEPLDLWSQRGFRPDSADVRPQNASGAKGEGPKAAEKT